MNTNENGRFEEIEKRLEELKSERSQLLKELGELRQVDGADESIKSPLVGRKLNFTISNNPEEKIQLFKKLFCCREDLFPRFWENQKNGKKGYSPVCSNEWVKPICNLNRENKFLVSFYCNFFIFFLVWNLI